MNEFKHTDNQELNKPKAEGFKNIKPENGMTKDKAKEIYNQGFKDDHGKNMDIKSSESLSQGGSYSEIKKHSDGNTQQVHHMPSDLASKLEYNDGPAIIMETDDHKKTASWGSSWEAREYRAKQNELIDNGDFRGALQMDINDIRDKFDSKYDKAISEMLSYVDKLEKEGKI